MRGRQVEFWYGLAVAVVKPLLLLFTRRDWRGVEHVPTSGAVIIAANHNSHLDPLTTAHYLYDGPRRLPRFIAKSELFKVPGLRRLLRGAKQIPVYRHTRDAHLALRDALTALEQGECVLIYPEGTLTRDPELWPMSAKTGVARLALESGVPVVPVAHWGAQDILWPYTKRPRLLPRKTIRVLAGPPVDLSAFAGQELTVEVLRKATEAIMSDVRALVGELRGEPAPAEVFDYRRDTA